MEHGILSRSILLFAARDDLQRIVRQWSLQFERLGRVGQQPQIDLCGLVRMTGIALG